MRVPISWLGDFVKLPETTTGREVSNELINLGLEVETLDVVSDVTGPVVFGVVTAIEELTEFKKPIRFCQVDVGTSNGGVRDIVCGAKNFAVGDVVVVALPGSVLPGGFAIAARQTYGHTSDGMICSARELELGDDHDGIMVLDPDSVAIGDLAGPTFGFGEEVLDIAVTPDRGYALSVRGVAREAAIAFGVPFRDKALELADLPAPADEAVPTSCSLDSSGGCDVFTARTILGVNASAPTPRWMTQRLLAAGMRPVSLIVDVTNYVMHETGQPLHAFDRDRIQGGLHARVAAAGETLTTLDHVERALDSEDLVIADDSGPLALAGTMGGVSSEISDGSTNVVLEAAHFDPVVVARMSRRHRLSTEASRRFERGVDPVIAPYASGYAASLILELAGGTYVGMTAEQSPTNRDVITMSAQRPAATAGMAISNLTTIDSLEAIGATVDANNEVLTIHPPSWRPDLTDPADAVEEVIRLIGYDRIPSRLPRAPAGKGLSVEQQLQRRASLLAASIGLVEVLNYPFLGPADLDKSGIPDDDPRRNGVRLVNPLSDEQPQIRTMLLPGLLSAARRNWSRGAESTHLFEIGSVAQAVPHVADRSYPRVGVNARPSDDELAELEQAVPEQHRDLAGVLIGPREQSGPMSQGSTSNWSDAISAATHIAEALGVGISVQQGSVAPFHPGRCAELRVGEHVIGYAGELHPRVCTAWELPARACAFEFNLDDVVTVGAHHIATAPAVHTFPVAKEDVALVVRVNISAATVRTALESGGGDLLESVRLFDVYQGDQVGEGLKSLAFALRFRAGDRTLDVNDVNSARAAAISAAREKCGAVLRS
jgi:phenylalanyl-tRNA synthetase beta chain